MPYFFPTHARIITSGMGDPRSYGGHEGIDIAPTAAEIRAGKLGVYSIAPGRVVKVGYMPGGYGNYVVVQHPGGETSLYGHLASIGVAEGQRVGAGSPLGVMGSTGYSTGIHLHLSVRDPQGRYLNPLTLSWSDKALAPQPTRKAVYTRRDAPPPRRQGIPNPRDIYNFFRYLNLLPLAAGKEANEAVTQAAGISSKVIEKAATNVIKDVTEKFTDKLKEIGPDLILGLVGLLLLFAGAIGLVIAVA